MKLTFWMRVRDIGSSSVIGSCEYDRPYPSVPRIGDSVEIIRDWVEEVQRVVWDRDGGSNLEFGDFAIEPMQGERPITLRQMGLLEEAGWEFS